MMILSGKSSKGERLYMKGEKPALAKEWLEKGRHDFEMAQLLYREKGYTDTIAFLIQQAVEKYLKGFLIYHGWELKKIHDLEALLSEAIKFDRSFEGFLPACRKITEYYIESRYPLGFPVDYSREEVKESLNIAEEIIAKIKQAVE